MRDVITRHIFDPWFWALKRMPVLNVYRDFRRLQHNSVEEFKRRQINLVRDLLLHAASRSPFYASRIDPSIQEVIFLDPLKALSLIPVLGKNDLRSHATEILVEMSRGTFVNRSGGSTGQPVEVYQDRKFQASSLATTLLMYEWAGKRIGDSHALLWGAERDLVKGGLGFKQHLADFIGNRITLNAFRLSPERMRHYARRLNAFAPVCLEGYAESLFEFARFLEREALTVRPPRMIVSSAGTLYPQMRGKIQQIFNAEVFDRYGSREVGNMAAECERHEGLHIFGETTVVEVVDAAGQPVAPGTEGDVLVTCLTNYTMPLIRYRIGDRAVFKAGLCSCGRPYPLLERIAGRDGASLRSLDGGVVSPEFFIHLIGVMHNDGRVGVFQVVQEALDRVVVRLAPTPGSDLRHWPARVLIERDIKTAMGTCEVEFRVEETIEPTPTGKHLYTINRVNSA